MAGKIYGDPGKVANAIAEKELEGAKTSLDDALGEGKRLIAEAYEKALKEAEGELRSEIGRAEEQLKSVLSTLELELKTAVSQLKTEHIEAVLREALSRVGEIKNTKEYEDYLARTLSRLASEGVEYVVRTSQDDISRVQALISRLGIRSLRVSREPAKILGGIIAETPDGSVRLDFSLDLLVEMNKHRLMSVASRVLFPEL